ncbi:hypothetical protein ACFVXE_18265 [Streptomyces sp. NPDC058231]|uniref:hypothetical protein n=1 Tax=Streptomyces sp. NPDC058231 TaxID=3346392 RepID=UPI0036E001FC
MGETLLALSVPALVLTGVIHAGCGRWRRRRSPAPPSPYTHQAARLAGCGTVLAAEEIVDGAYAALGRFYGIPGAPDPATEDAVTAATAATTGGAAGVTRGAAASPGHGQSSPASVRRG